jgi:hypothetical protein
VAVPALGELRTYTGGAVFIRRGDVVSGIYTYGPQDAAVRLAVRLARASAVNLRRS